MWKPRIHWHATRHLSRLGSQAWALRLTRSIRYLLPLPVSPKSSIRICLIVFSSHFQVAFRRRERLITSCQAFETNLVLRRSRGSRFNRMRSSSSYVLSTSPGAFVMTALAFFFKILIDLFVMYFSIIRKLAVEVRARIGAGNI